MKQSYLIFKMGAVSFLLPLESVVHILPSEAADESMEYEGRPVRLHEAVHSLSVGGQKRLHAVILKKEDEYHALLVEQVLGVSELSDEQLLEIPGEVRWEKNRFLQAAVKTVESGGWAYLLNVPELLNEENRDDTDV